ncbi:hypothetical protein ACWDSL_03930 [Streptomyces sp. NPDC000941]
MPVEGDQLLVTDMTGRGDILLPAGPVYDKQTPEQAAQAVLRGASSGLVHRQVAVDCVQMRRRKVITHIVATKYLARTDVAHLTYRDGRAIIRALPIAPVTANLSKRAQAWVFAGLQALADDEMVSLEAGVVCRTKPTSIFASGWQ